MSRVFRLSRGVLALCAGAVLAACSQIQLTHQVAEHNRALELSGNEVILLNVVRASKGYPLYFTYLGDMQGKDAASGTLGGSLAFGNHQILKHTGSPSLQLNNGIQQFNVGNPNSDDFAASLVSPLTADVVALFLNSDWPIEHFSMLVVRRIGLGKVDYASLKENQEERCRSDENAVLCRAIEADEAQCGEPKSETVNLGKYGQTIPLAKPEQIWVFDNNPEDRCEFTWFQMAVRRLVLARPFIIKKAAEDPDKTKQGSTAAAGGGSGGGVGAPKKAAGGKGGGVASSPAQLTITHVVSQQGQDKQSQAKSSLYLRVEIKRRTGRIDLYDLPVGESVGGPVGGQGAKVGKTFFMLRSPADIITYLGRLTRLQLGPGRHRDVRVVAGKSELLSIFRISEGAIDSGAVSVMHEGQRFVVPPNSYDPRERHLSLQSLMLVNQLLAMRLKRDNLKNNTTLFVGQ